MMELFKKNKKDIEIVSANKDASQESIVCPVCKREIFKEEAKSLKYICPKCNYYFRVRAKNRIKMIVDENSFVSLFEDIVTGNPLSFPDYETKINDTVTKTKLSEGVMMGTATIGGNPVVIGVVDARFLMGSMGQAVGERITRGVEKATKDRLPIILFCCSGGARMQEGIVSLMQMAKTSAALKRHSQEGLLYISVLTDPTTGGVTASFAMLGDVILAEPKALIGFAGPRVIEQTIGQKLPEGFQRSEFQLEHGFIDAIVERNNLRDVLMKLVDIHKEGKGFASFDPSHDKDIYEPTEIMKERAVKSKPLDVWDKVCAARQLQRLQAEDYIKEIFDDFIELHGDRYFRDDPAIMGGIAYLDGQPVTVIGVNKGKSLEDCKIHNYGMPSPEGYRKAIRLMKEAEKFKRPIITFVNTSGAYPGMEAEENGQGEAIARNLFEMSGLEVPILAVMIGEGGSGGALALAVGNEVWMEENATYSILSPEGFASILWKDSSRAKEAAEVMKITAHDLKELQVIDEIIPEYGMADEAALSSISAYMKGHMKEFLRKCDSMTPEEIKNQRYERFRKF